MNATFWLLVRSSVTVKNVPRLDPRYTRRRGKKPKETATLKRDYE